MSLYGGHNITVKRKSHLSIKLFQIMWFRIDYRGNETGSSLPKIDIEFKTIAFCKQIKKEEEKSDYFS